MDNHKTESDEIQFAEEIYESCKDVNETALEWKLLIVDDEKEIHQITKLALQNFSYEGRKLKFISAYSGNEAKEVLQKILTLP